MFRILCLFVLYELIFLGKRESLNMRLIRLLKDPRIIILKMIGQGMFEWMPEERIIKIMYKIKMNKDIDLEKPTTFNEKMQWLKLYDRKDEYTIMVDKYEARNYIADKVGKEYLVPLLGVWDNFDEISFDDLPNQFVLKTTHDSGGVIVCQNKSELNWEKARKKINKCLKTNYYYRGREYPYKNIKPRIIAEKYLASPEGDLKDFKIMCFNGKPKIILTCSERFYDSGLKLDFFDTEWNHLDVCRPKASNSSHKIERPTHLEEMLFISKEIAKDMSFVRVDFFEVNNKIYLGEITLYPSSGFEAFVPESFDNILGNILEL